MRLYYKDFKVLLALAIPLIITGFVESSINFSANFFLAHLGLTELAAGALVSWTFSTLMIILWGIMQSISVLTSRHFGAKDTVAVSLVLREGIWLSILLFIPASLLIWYMTPLLHALGQPASILKQVIPYAHSLAWAVLPDFMGLALLQFIIGLGQTRTMLVFTLCWVPLNIFLDYIFIYGKLGFKTYGIAGLGWGTTWSYWITLIGLLIYMILQPTYRPYWIGIFSFKNVTYLWELFKVGLPIGLMWFVEVSFFLALALIMGTHSKDILAANQLTMQYVAFFVSISFSMAQAITVRMGHLIGAQDNKRAHRVAFMGSLISLALTLLVVLWYWLTPRAFIDLDFNAANEHNTIMVTYAIRFLAIAAIFQLLESVRISLFGALRALKDTRFTLFTSFIAFWCLALPLGWLMIKLLHWNVVAYWVGLSLSSLINLLLLVWRYRDKARVELGVSEAQPR